MLDRQITLIGKIKQQIGNRARVASLGLRGELLRHGSSNCTDLRGYTIELFAGHP
ncbi:hypothetical protein MCEMSEM23_02503 [Rhabdaerophilaceae bacterium]